MANRVAIAVARHAFRDRLDRLCAARHLCQTAPLMSSPRPNAAASLLVPACFFVSGFAGLALEMVWSRLLALHLGGSAEAVTAVVTAYMAGLGLGSLIVSSFTSRIRLPLRWYAVLEIAVALFAIASPAILKSP